MAPVRDLHEGIIESHQRSWILGSVQVGYQAVNCEVAVKGGRE